MSPMFAYDVIRSVGDLVTVDVNPYQYPWVGRVSEIRRTKDGAEIVVEPFYTVGGDGRRDSMASLKHAGQRILLDVAPEPWMGEIDRFEFNWSTVGGSHRTTAHLRPIKPPVTPSAGACWPLDGEAPAAAAAVNTEKESPVATVEINPLSHLTPKQRTRTIAVGIAEQHLGRIAATALLSTSTPKQRTAALVAAADVIATFIEAGDVGADNTTDKLATACGELRAKLIGQRFSEKAAEHLVHDLMTTGAAAQAAANVGAALAGSCSK